MVKIRVGKLPSGLPFRWIVMGLVGDVIDFDGASKGQ